MKFQASAYKEDSVPCPPITSWRMRPHSHSRKPQRDTWSILGHMGSNTELELTNLTIGGTWVRHNFSDSPLHSHLSNKRVHLNLKGALQYRGRSRGGRLSYHPTVHLYRFEACRILVVLYSSIQVEH